MKKHFAIVSFAVTTSIASAQDDAANAKFDTQSSAKDNWTLFITPNLAKYDTTDFSAYGVYAGAGYKTQTYGTHSVLFGMGKLVNSQNDTEPSSFISNKYLDIDSLSFAYRFNYPVKERIDLFAEIGSEKLTSESKLLSDALGNPIIFGGNTDTNHFIGIGGEGKLYKSLHLSANLRYFLSPNDVFKVTASGADALGNPVIINQNESPTWMGSVGLTFKF